MFETLAVTGEGLHVSGVRTLLAILLLTTAVPAAAQVKSIDELLRDGPPPAAEDAPLQEPRADAPDPDDPLPWPGAGESAGAQTENLPDGLELFEGRDLTDEEREELRGFDADEIAELNQMMDGIQGMITGEVTEEEMDALLEGGDGDGDITIDPAIPDAPPSPDYASLPPKAERAARLDALHARLAVEDDKQSAELISEEIWAIWMDSGSASVNYLLVRADAAMKRGDTVEAKRMIDLMLDLEPEFAEGWSRSARLALVDEDYGRAAAHATQSLIHNPRHYYSLWTLGNVLERLGRNEEALEVYEEAHALFPKLGNVKERLDALRSEVLGDVL